MGRIDVEQAGFEVPGDLRRGLEGFDVAHFLDLFLLGCALDLVTSEAAL
jgi:hypothetical protein